MTVNEDAQVVAGALAAAFRVDNDGFAMLLQLLDRDARRLLHAFLDVDSTLLRTLAEKHAQAVLPVVDAIVSSLETTRGARAEPPPAFFPEAWDAAVIVLRMLGDAATAASTITITKPADVTPRAWLTGWYIVAQALTIELGEVEGMSPEEMAQNIALNYANWTA
jgi:hypothetical protein